DPGTYVQTGQWWLRRVEGLYFPRVSLAEFSRGVPPELCDLFYHANRTRSRDGRAEGLRKFCDTRLRLGQENWRSGSDHEANCDSANAGDNDGSGTAQRPALSATRKLRKAGDGNISPRAGR